MQLIINIDEETYKKCKWKNNGVVGLEWWERAIANGTPLNLQEQTGHWVEENINEWSRKIYCSECGCPPPFEHVSNGDVYSASGYGVTNKTKHCPGCGARMIESEENK